MADKFPSTQKVGEGGVQDQDAALFDLLSKLNTTYSDSQSGIASAKSEAASATSALSLFLSSLLTPGYVLCDTPNGHGGASATCIRRFTNSTTVGTAITRASSAADGDTFTVNKKGIYGLVWSDSRSGGVSPMGFSINSTQLTTSIAAINAANKTAILQTVASQLSSISWIGLLNVGDIVRCQDDTGLNNADTNGRFTIVKIVEIP